jgi:UDP-N-acetylmuramate--alanine ligase
VSVSSSQKTVFLCGIGGSGVSALVPLLIQQGFAVRGSDRSRDKGDSLDKFAALEKIGARLFPQDGSGLDGVDELIVSSAVELSVPDVKAALDRNISIRKRAEVLAGLFNAGRGIGIGGTSGKTTVTGMLGHILCETGREPTVVNGGIMREGSAAQGLGNVIVGASDLFVSELDESDGSIALFDPAVAVLNNITLDHKPIADLRPLFHDFLMRAREGAVVNLDDPEAALMRGIHPKTVTYSLADDGADLVARNIAHHANGVRFDVSGIPVHLAVPGRHNVSNALAAMAAARMVGVPLKDAAKALESFKGIRRRLEVVGTKNGVTVIDDFAHNPDKIAASLQALHEAQGRLWVMFQMHGFAPAKLMRKELVEAFVQELKPDDVLMMPEIYYAGGTVERSISSRDILDDVQRGGRQVQFFDKRADVLPFLIGKMRSGDRVVIMGARDDTLTDFAQSVLDVVMQNFP